MSYLEKMNQTIRTYLLVIRTNSHLDEYDTLDTAYEICSFNVSAKTVSYNIHNLAPMVSTFKFSPSNSDDFDKIVKDLEPIAQGLAPFKKKVCVVKFWGNISQEFIFMGSFLKGYDESGLEVNHDFSSFSEKDTNVKKYTKLLLPYLRDRKLDQILPNI